MRRCVACCARRKYPRVVVEVHDCMRGHSRTTASPGPIWRYTKGYRRLKAQIHCFMYKNLRIPRCMVLLGCVRSRLSET